MEKLKVEYMPVGDLIPYEGNAKLHPEEQVEQIKESIEQFGFNDPIAIDRHSVIVEGHGRLMAAKELGIKKSAAKTYTQTFRGAFRENSALQERVIG